MSDKPKSETAVGKLEEERPDASAVRPAWHPHEKGNP